MLTGCAWQIASASIAVAHMRAPDPLEVKAGEAPASLAAGHQAFPDLIDRDVQRRPWRTLGGAGLQQEQLAVLDGELELLGVTELGLQHPADLIQALVHLGCEQRQLPGSVLRAAAADDVLALRVGQELDVGPPLARGRIAGEADA